MYSMEYPALFRRNRNKLVEAALAEGFDGVLLLSASNILYATGIREPSGFAYISDSCGDFIATSLLDAHRIEMQAPREAEVIVFYRSGEELLDTAGVERSRRVEGGVKEAIDAILRRCEPKRIAADLSQAQAAVADWARGAANSAGVEIADFTEKVSDVRSVKEDWEVELIMKAQSIAEEALRRAIEAITPESREASLAGIVKKELMELGAWTEAFQPIVAFHENTALPHHTPTDRILGPSGAVLFDLGAVYTGYRSDLTRSFWWGGGGSEYRKLLEAVSEALSEAVDSIAPGVQAWEPDKTARLILEKRGLSKYFIHGLGHGLGVDVHEKPYLRPGSKEELKPGNVVTVEPGVYMPGLHGARIEDVVLVTKRGRRVLTRLSRLLELL